LTPVSGDRERIYFVSYPIENAEGGIGAYVILSKVIKVKLLLEYRVFGILITLFICIAIVIIFVSMQKKEALIKYIQEVNAKLEAAGQVKTDFLSIVSHDLKTPLTAIKNAVTILIRDKMKNGFSSAQEKELMELILKNTERQASMVSNLLDVTKIESGVLSLNIKYYDLWTLTRDALQILNSQAKEKNISIDLKSSVQTLTVPVDIDHTERILGNLIGNAIRYSPENSHVIVEIIEQEDDVLMSVTDKGYGIHDSEVDKIFDKFYRSPDATLREKGGTGLGLVITKGLVELQGGKIWVKSKLGEGTTFYFTLPKWQSR
jgi:signal transduction histidine kinase